MSAADVAYPGGPLSELADALDADGRHPWPLAWAMTRPGCDVRRMRLHVEAAWAADTDPMGMARLIGHPLARFALGHVNPLDLPLFAARGRTVWGAWEWSVTCAGRVWRVFPCGGVVNAYCGNRHEPDGLALLAAAVRRVVIAPPEPWGDLGEAARRRDAARTRRAPRFRNVSRFTEAARRSPT